MRRHFQFERFLHRRFGGAGSWEMESWHVARSPLLRHFQATRQSSIRHLLREKCLG